MQEAAGAGESCGAGYGLWQAWVFYGHCAGLLVAAHRKHYHLPFHYLHPRQAFSRARPLAHSLPPLSPGPSETYRYGAEAQQPANAHHAATSLCTHVTLGPTTSCTPRTPVIQGREADSGGTRRSAPHHHYTHTQFSFSLTLVSLSSSFPPKIC